MSPPPAAPTAAAAAAAAAALQRYIYGMWNADTVFPPHLPAVDVKSQSLDIARAIL